MKKEMFTLVIASVGACCLAVDHVWLNAEGGDLFDSANWATEANFALNGDHANAFFTNGPLTSKTLTYTGEVSLVTLNIDATLGDGSPIVFHGLNDAASFNIDYVRTIKARGTVEWRDKLRSWSEIVLDGGEHVLHESTDYYTSLPNSNPRFHLVNGAKIVYDGATRESPNDVPEGAWMHLDASRPDTMQFVEGDGGVQYVQQWNDVRGADYPYAFAPSAQCRPVYAGNLAGARYLDFGPLVIGSPETGHGRTLNWSAANGDIRTAFVVFSDLRTSQYAQSIICRANGSHRLSFFRGTGNPQSGGALLYSESAEAWTSGRTIYDGRDLTGMAIPRVPADSFHVVCTVSDTGLNGEAFARDGTSHGGGIQIAECIVYNRRLTDAECDDVFAYLAAKWQGKSYKNYRAGNNGPFGVIRADNGSTLDARADVVAELIDANGENRHENNTLNIIGGGGVTAAKIKAGTVNFSGAEFSVKGLDVAELTVPTPLAHWDASDTNSMELVESGGETYVNRWFPVDGKKKDGSFQATAISAAQRPRLARVPGLAYTCLDFGSLDNTASKTNAACMALSTVLDRCVRSVVMVVADHDDDDRAGFLGHDRLPGDGNFVSFCRGSLGALLNDSNSYVAGGARLGVNGWPALPGSVFPGGFNVLSYSFPVAMRRVNYFCSDRDIWYGGLRYAEIMLFDCELGEGQVRALENSLAKKWFGRNIGAVRRADEYGPASNAWLHIDASALDSLTLGDNNDVVQWRDRNGNGRFCAPPPYARHPVLVNDGNAAYVDMGILSFDRDGTRPTAPHLLLSETNLHCYTAFVVHSDADSGYDQNVIGSCDPVNMPLFCRGANKFPLDLRNAHWAITNGTHFLDGVPCDFTATPIPSGFHVLCFETIKTDLPHAPSIRVDCFGADYRTRHAGGQKLAECIIYDRRLNPLERDDTMAYLMNKYKRTAAAGESHIKTFNASNAGVTRFAVDGGRGLAIGVLNAQNGIAKSGGGVLAVGATTARALDMGDGTLACEGTLALDSLAVRGGTIEGDLQLGDGAVLTTTLGDDAQGCVTVKGTLNALGTITVNVDASGLTQRVEGDMPLVNCASVTGTPVWRVAVAGNDLHGRVIRTPDGVVIRYSYSGTSVILR